MTTISDSRLAPNRPWKMLTWSNGDGTGDVTERRYSSRASAVRAANKLRQRRIVALVEHENEQPSATHWRD
jgi:hypothetical protein